MAAIDENDVYRVSDEGLLIWDHYGSGQLAINVEKCKKQVRDPNEYSCIARLYVVSRKNEKSVKPVDSERIGNGIDE